MHPYRRAWLLAAGVWSLLMFGFALRSDADAWLWQALADARFAGVSTGLVASLFWALLATLVSFALLGIFFTLAWRPGPGWAAAIQGGTAGLASGCGVAFLLAGVDGWGRWHAPGILELGLPFCGVLLGVAFAGALRKPGWRVLPALAGRLLIVLLLGSVAMGLLAWQGLQLEPADVPMATITSADKRELVGELQRHNPFQLAEGEHAVLVLTPARLDNLLAWAALLVDPQAGVEVQPGEEALRWTLSVRLPVGLGARRQLTAGGEFAVEVAAQQLRVRRCVLEVGSLHSPRWLCAGLLRSLHRRVSATPELSGVAAAVEMLRVDGAGLWISYARPAFGTPVWQHLQRLVGPGPTIAAATRAQFDLLRDEGPRLARSEDRLGALFGASFALARARAEQGHAVAENQGAILALATVLGHHEVATAAGVERPEDWRRIRDGIWPVSLRGRVDWTRHFLVSAAITQISTALVSDAAGLLKEELDAVRPSGFSFADLLADRAGTRFGELAARNETTARALQDQLVERFRVDDIMPPAADLPEGLNDAEFEARFGGVGGPGYLALVAEIERRLAALPDPLAR